MELFDPRQRAWHFVRLSELDSDLDGVRAARAELTGAPCLAEAAWLPSREELSESLSFNRLFVDRMEALWVVNPDRHARIRAAAGEAERLYAAYDLARDAASDFYYVVVRRRALQRLRGVLGEDDWRERRLPPPVPTWMFSER